MKKFLTLGVAAIMAVTGAVALASCGGTNSNENENGGNEEGRDTTTVKVGMIALHDTNSTYDKNFIEAMQAACKEENVELVLRTGVDESNACYDAAAELAEQGCNIVFADSFGHESYMVKAAKEFTDVQFCHATGTNAKVQNLSNYHNAFASIYEGRYLAGVAAGMKLVEMYNNGEIKDSNYDSDGNIKIGYVGAYPYAEVISGYTSFFLGARSIVEEETEISISMEVQFTSSWYNEQAEKESALNLINRGAALISQHADSMGAPSACESMGVPNVSYNGSTESSCPNTFIVSSRIDWTPYFKYIIECVKDNKAIDTDWCGTIETGSVVLTDFGAKATAAGTAEKVAEVKAKLQAGTLSVFDTAKFTVNGEHLTSYIADVVDNGDYVAETEVISNGVFQESTLPAFRSAPYFDIQIDGITQLK